MLVPRWVSLTRSPRKAQEARKKAKLDRPRLVQDSHPLQRMEPQAARLWRLGAAEWRGVSCLSTSSESRKEEMEDGKLLEGA